MMYAQSLFNSRLPFFFPAIPLVLIEWRNIVHTSFELDDLSLNCGPDGSAALKTLIDELRSTIAQNSACKLKGIMCAAKFFSRSANFSEGVVVLHCRMVLGRNLGYQLLEPCSKCSPVPIAEREDCSTLFRRTNQNLDGVGPSFLLPFYLWLVLKARDVSCVVSVQVSMERSHGGVCVVAQQRVQTEVPVQKWPRLSEQLSPIYKWTSGSC